MKKLFLPLIILLIIGCTKGQPGTKEFSFSLGDIDGTTINGGKVDSSIYRDYDLTMVNVFATWCAPCVKEMPELQKVKEQLPKGVNLIAICDDAQSSPELAKKIIEKSGVKFDVLIPEAGIKESVIKGVQAFPTTFFVDKNGKMVGGSIIGVNKKGVVEFYLNEIKRRVGHEE